MNCTIKNALKAGTALAYVSGTALVYVGSFTTAAHAGSCVAGANAANCTINATAPDNTGFTMTLNSGVTATVDQATTFTGGLTGTDNTNILDLDATMTLSGGVVDGVNIDIGSSASGFQGLSVGNNVVGGTSSIWDVYGGTGDSLSISGGGTFTANRDGATDADQSEFVITGGYQQFGATTVTNFNEVFSKDSSGQLNLQQGTMNANVFGANAFTTGVTNGATLNLAEGLIVRNQVSSTTNFTVDNATVNLTGALDTTAYTADNLAFSFATAGTSESVANFENIEIRSNGSMNLSAAAGGIVSSGTEANFTIRDTATVTNNSAQPINFTNTAGANFILEDGGTYTSTSVGAFINTASSNVTIGDLAAGGTATFNIGGGDFISQSGSSVTLREGASLTVGDASFLAGTTLDLVISNDGTGTIMASNAVDLDNATITVTDGGNNTFGGNTSFLIADASSNQTITERSVGTVNGFDIRLVDGTFGSIGGDATQAYLIAFLAAISGAQGANNIEVEALLNTIITTSDPQLSQIVTNLQNAASTSEYNQILESILPTVDGGDLVGALQFVGQTMDITADRLDALTGAAEGFGYSDARSKKTGRLGARVWAQAFGRAADQGALGGVAGFNSNTAGAAAGIDSDDIFEDVIIGLGLSYARTSVGSDNSNNTKTNIDSYQATLYGQKQLDASTYFRGMAAYVYGDNKRVRHNVGGVAGLNASSNFKSDLFTVYGEFGREFTPANTDAVLTPNLNLRYTHYNAGSFTETGAGGANLSVDQQAVNKLELGAGIDAKWSIEQDDGAVLIPQLRAGISYDVIGEQLDASSTLAGGGAAFKTVGLKQGRITGNLGAGFTYQTTKGWDVSMNYDLELKESFQSHSGFARIGFKF